MGTSVRQPQPRTRREYKSIRASEGHLGEVIGSDFIRSVASALGGRAHVQSLFHRCSSLQVEHSDIGPP